MKGRMKKLLTTVMTLALVGTIGTGLRGVPVFAQGVLPGARHFESSSHDVFLGGNYIEVGVAPHGSFGTNSQALQYDESTAPSGFHCYVGGANNAKMGRLGLISDGDGWNVGNSKVSGDFFTPGSQYEQWVLSYKVDGVKKTYCIADMANRDIGSWQVEPLASDISYGDTLSARVNGITADGLEVTIVYSFDVNDKQYLTEVLLTNRSSNTITDVFFSRQVDPDQDYFTDKEFKTYNKIVCNPSSLQEAGENNYALVVARGAVSLDGFFFIAFDNRARVTGWSGSNANLEVESLWNNALVTSKTYAEESDIACSELNPNGHDKVDNCIGIVIKLGEIASGNSDTTSFYTSLDPDVLSALQDAKEMAQAADADSTSTTVTVKGTASDYYYALYSTEDVNLSGWISGSITQSEAAAKQGIEIDGLNIVFTGLTPDTDYIVKSVLSSDVVDGIPVQSAIPGEKEVTTAIAPLGENYEVGGENENGPEITLGCHFIEFTGLDKGYEYALFETKKGKTPITEYKTPDETGYIRFDDLDDGKTYYLGAKSLENALSDKVGLTTKVYIEVETPTVVPGATSVIIKSSQVGVYYGVFDLSGNLVAGWAQGTGNNLKLTGLAQATDFSIKGYNESDYDLFNEGMEPEGGITIQFKTLIDINEPADPEAEDANKIRIVPTDSGCRILYANPGFLYKVVFEDDTPIEGQDYVAPDEKGELLIKNLPSDSALKLIAKKDSIVSENGISFRTLANGESLYGKIDYTKRSDVFVYAYSEEGVENEGIYINMTKEKLTSSFSYNCYSINGGRKWVSGKLSDATLEKLMNSGFSLVLADKYDSKKKTPGEDATYFYFDQIYKRPTAKTYKTNYITLADIYGATNGQWILTFNRQPADMSKIEIGISDSTGKKIGKEGFGIWPDIDGVWVPKSAADDKTTSYTYYYRIMASETHGASKTKKIKVSGLIKAPKLKVNYTSETLKLPIGSNCYFGATMPAPLVDTLSYDNALFETYDTNAFEKLSDYEGKGLIKLTAATTIKLGGYIGESRNIILVWNSAKETKPATAKQQIKLAARAKVTSKTLTVKNGKITDFPKGYEIYNEEKSKWSTTMPKFSGDAEVKIRVKSVAKGGKETNDTKASSLPGKLVVTYGVIDKEKGTEGIISAKITP